jgi:hypothetical protein
MKITESLNISDSKIRGVVVIKDWSGKIILKKENMIVESGRKIIRDVFIKNGIFVKSSFIGTYSSYLLTHVVFGSSDVASQSTMTALESEVLRVRLVESDVVVADNSVQIKFKAIADLTNSLTGITIKELGLLAKKFEGNIETNDETLFSRAVFDSIPVAAGEKYEVEYYIYF